MTTWLVEPENNVEVRLDRIESITTLTSRRIKRYASQATNKPNILLEEPQPNVLRVQCKLSDSSQFEDYKRKLSYLEMSGKDLLLILGSEQEAVYGGLERVNMPRTARAALVMPLTFDFVVRGTVLGHMREAEDCNILSGATAVSDSNASNNTTMQLTNQYSGVYFYITQSVWELPEGDYKLFVRAKDSNNVANDFKFSAKNSTDAITISSSTVTLTSSYLWYGLDFSLDSDDVGDIIWFDAEKSTTTANTISVDLLAVVMV